MISKKQISTITSLQQKKFRKETGLFIAEGEKIVSELLQSDFNVREIYALDGFVIPKTGKGIQATIVTEKELHKISALTTAQSVVAIAEIPKYALQLSKLKSELTLVLDDIKDPCNLVTIIRIADLFGITNIFCSEKSVDAFNPKVVQAAMGSLFRVKVFYSSLEKVFEDNKTKDNLAVYGTLLKGENIYDASLGSSGFILIGNESEGISKTLHKYITDTLTIPSFSRTKSGKIDSLNAAIATGIICSEFRSRQSD